MNHLLTKSELAKLLNVSTRTVDRWRSMGFDVGEIRLTPNSYPRFDPAKVSAQIETGKFGRVKK